MYPLDAFDEEIRRILASKGIDDAKLAEAPEGRGDRAFACFSHAKARGISPKELAERLEAEVKAEKRSMIKDCRAEGGYLNFFVDESLLAEKLFRAVRELGDDFGRGERKEEKVLLEHTSANPTGPLHVGRARNPIIGDTLARILRFDGYEVKTEYYVDDAGMQVAMLAWGVKNFETGEEKKGDHRLVKCYQQAAKLKEEDPRVEEEIRNLLRRYESGDEDAAREIESAYKQVLSGIIESLEGISVHVDSFVHESKFLRNGDVERVIEMLRPYAQEKEGALCIDLKPYGIDDLFFLTRADGTTLYATRDIAYHLDKFSRCDIAINILGEDHKLESKSLSVALSLMGQKVPEVIFYAFISLPEGKMSTRKERVVYLDDLVEEAVARAREEVLKRRGDLEEEDVSRISRAIGAGAVRYNIVKVQAGKQIKFRWEEALSLEGNSAPFLQYSYARAKSILRKAGEHGLPEALRIDGERGLLKSIAEFPSTVDEASKQRAPHMLAEYLLTLASEFNLFYKNCPVLNAGVEREQRLLLVEAFAQTMRNGLGLLGVEPLEEM